MKLYLVRHGETETNTTSKYPSEKEGLSPDGVKEAQALANRFRKIKTDALITSDSARALQTTKEIERVIRKSVEKTELLRERRRPSEFEGAGLHDPKVMEIKKEILQHIDNPVWRYSDEETTQETTARAQKFIKMMEARKEKHIVAVSHRGFIKYIISCLLFESDVTPKLAEYVYHFFSASNTGITLCERFMNPDQERLRWRLITWNDHAHLG